MNVIILKEKLDALAEAIGIKSKVRLPLTIDEQIEAVNLIKTDPKLQDKSVSLTPKKSAQTATVTADKGYDGLDEVSVRVEKADLQEASYTFSSYGTNVIYPSGDHIGLSSARVSVPSILSYIVSYSADYVIQSSALKYRFRPYFYTSRGGWITSGYKYSGYSYYDAIPTGTTITPTTEAQTIGGSNVMLQGAITVSAMPTGTAGTPTATKSAVSNHSVSVTPSVTNTTGYIEGSTKTGTAVSVTAAELVSGSQTITENASNIDVTNLASVDVAVPAPTPTLETVTKSYAPTESQQTETITPSTGHDGIGEVDVTVDAISSSYVGSAIDRRDSTDLSASGATVTAPAGYYASSATKTVASGTAGTPALTVSAVQNHAKTIRSSVINQTGWITGGTVSGASTTVSASDLVSGTKSITSNGTDIDVTNYATVDVAVPSGSPTIQSLSVTPSTSQQTFNASGVDGYKPVVVDAMPSGSAGTPTATKGTVSNHSVSVTPSVTNTTGYITGGTKTGTAVSVSASELVSGTVNITSSGNTDVTNYATASVASGSATASATKGAVSNHSVTVTPSVTRTAGYVTAGTTSGTAVTVSASELVSGSETKTTNGTYDVTNLAEIVVDVQGGGGGGVQIGKTTKTLVSSASSIQFTGLSGNPTSFVVTSAEDIATNTSGVTAVVFDGTSLHGQTMTTQVTADTGFTKSYSNGTLTITATTASFRAVEYKLVYTYGGSASDIETADVQVGSGATSITFPVTGRPAYWSCIFKSDFSTSSGYQRVIEVVNDGSSTYGLAMDSSAHAASSWTASYSGGSLTITSSGTNNGGYFHQPGYYQLTYYVDASAPSYQTKSAYATTTAQTITPDSGYDALESVSIGAISQTNLIADNIKSGTTISISNGSTNLWSVVGTYTGGGGGTLTVKTATITKTSTGQTLSFTSLSGEPKYWFLRATTNVSSSGSTTYYYVTDLFYDGTNIKGNTFRIGSTRRVQNITSGITQSYNSGTLTITAGSSSGATPGQFYGASNFGYELVYIY